MALPLILIVDDKPENLTVLGGLLQAEHAVRVANSGVRALRLARLRPLPQLVLLGVMLPEMDGHEVLRQLREGPETAHIPVIFLSALADAAGAQSGLHQGAADCATQPLEPALLLARVRQHLPAGPPITPAGLATALQVPGLTMSRALMYLPGRDAVFERVLRLFASQYPQGLEGLAAALGKADWRQLQRLLHSLRGACGAIGATDLLARAGALDAALDPASADPADPGALARQAWQIDADLRVLVAAVQAGLAKLPPPASATSPGAPVDRSALHPAMDALAAQLRVADFAASAALRALAPQLLAALGSAAVQPVAEALARHDYDAALLALHGLRHPAASAQPPGPPSPPEALPGAGRRA